MKSTTVKVSIETRERIRALGGETCDETINEALDALEAERFWSQVDAAVARRNALSDAERAAYDARIAEIDAAFSGIR
jgi:hypothetical protein